MRGLFCACRARERYLNFCQAVLVCHRALRLLRVGFQDLRALEQDTYLLQRQLQSALPLVWSEQHELAEQGNATSMGEGDDRTIGRKSGHEDKALRE